MGTPVRSVAPERQDPEQQFSVADPGKEWRRGHRIPVVPSFDGYRAYAIIGVVLFHIFQVSGVFAAVGDSALGVLFWGDPAAQPGRAFHRQRLRHLPAHRRPGRGLRRRRCVRGPARGAAGARLLRRRFLLLCCSSPAVESSTGLPGAGEIGAHLAVIQTPLLLFVKDFDLGFGVVPPVWTLSVEVGFYVVLPLVAVYSFAIPSIGLLAATGDCPGLDGTGPPRGVRRKRFRLRSELWSAGANRHVLCESVPRPGPWPSLRE